jgi:hypothetical protein
MGPITAEATGTTKKAISVKISAKKSSLTQALLVHV